MSITTFGSSIVHYEALGRGSPVIFLHGWLGSWRYWWRSMQALSTSHRTLAFDMWGFGDSSKRSEMYDLGELVEMLKQLIDRLGVVPPVTLVGHALGAAVALKYTAEYPSNVSGLVAVSLPIRGHMLDVRLQSLEPQAFLERISPKGTDLPEVAAEMRKVDPVAVKVLVSEALVTDLVPDLDWVTCKIMLIFGEHDVVVRPPNGEYDNLFRTSAQRLKVTLPGSSHFPMLEEAAVFNRLLLEFIHTRDQDLANISPKELWQRRTR